LYQSQIFQGLAYPQNLNILSVVSDHYKIFSQELFYRIVWDQ
ncbi:unnamed protein product, partial [marine sediment metagenome]